MKLLAALLIGVLATLALPFALILMVVTTGTATATAPSGVALADIPAEYLARYQAAPAVGCPGLSWTILASIGKQETDHGRSTLPGVASGQNVAGAAGPMQIGVGGAATNNWGGEPVRTVPPELGVGRDGDGDGVASVYEPADAILGAAVFLCRRGGGDPARVREAVWSYNPVQWYVDEVLARAAEYGRAAVAAVPPATGDLIGAVLANPRIRIYEGGRRDIAEGAIDARVLQLLQTLAQRQPLVISSLKSGHSRCVAGGGTCNVSNHWYGRAVDIAVVGGASVRPGNAAARDLALLMAELPPPVRPSEVGSPWRLPDLPGMEYFTDADHQDHLHVGFEGAP